MQKIKKIKKLLLVLILLVCSNLQADKVNVTLREFASIVATENKINILISSDIKEDKVLFILANKKNKIFLPAFKRMLYIKDMELIKQKGFYYIDKIKVEVDEVIEEIKPEKMFYSIKLNNLVFEDVNKLLQLNNIKSIYIKTTNSVCFFALEDEYKKLSTNIKDLDIKLPQIQFKITIFTTNKEDLKERGFNISAYAHSLDKSDSSGENGTSSTSFMYFLNLITMPYNVPSNVVANSSSGLYTVVKYLNQNGFTEIENSPILTAKSHSKVSFSTVKNIPYLTSSVTTESTDTKTTESLEYKDVGMKIDISPVVINDVINFDLNLIIEELTSNSSLTPTTEKRQLNSSYSLKRGEILVLSGVNKSSTLTTDFGIPLLQEVWLLGELFKYKTTTISKSILTITVEVL